MLIEEAQETFERARRVIAGGVDSPVRAGSTVGGTPFVQARGDGAYAYDQAGRRYIDYVMAYGPLLFGHAHPVLSNGLDEIARRGTVYGSTHEDEVVLAERITKMLPSMQRLRFATTGTEAIMGALRVARAFTGKSLILKFGGNYHGHSDFALLGAGASADTGDARRAGIPISTLHDLAVARYNDLADVDRVLAGREGELAAIVVEPIVGNMGLVHAEPGFLEGLAERAHSLGALLIFDEVITWLRFGLGGAQARLNIAPDLTTLGKVLGGGHPLAAFGGRSDVMAMLAPQGATFSGGTHAGNPFAIAMGHRVLDLLEGTPQLYAQMRAMATRLAAGIKAALREHALDYAVLVDESVVDFKFRVGPATRSFDDQQLIDRAAFANFYHAMRERGVLLAPSYNEVMFVSTAHSQSDIEQTIAAVHASL